MTEAQKHIPLSSLMRYGFIALPVAFAGLPIYLIAPDYYASQFGLSLTSLGAVLLFLRFVDGVQDPFIGAFSDRFHHKRPLIILSAALVLVSGFWCLFQPPAAVAYLAWFAISVFVITTAYSVLVINITALGGIWARDPHERTRIAMVREVHGLIGLLLVIVLASSLTNHFPVSHVYAVIAILLFVLLSIGVALFLNWYAWHSDEIEPQSLLDPKAAPKGERSFFHLWASMTGETKSFFLIYGLSMLASSIPAVLVIFYVRDFLQAPLYLGLFLSLYFLSGAVGMLLWSKLSRQLDNKLLCWQLGMAVATLSFIWVMFLEPGDVFAYGVICVLSGLGFGADLSLPPSLLADQISAQKREPDSGFYHAQLTLLTKLSLALSTALIFPLLETAGYRPAQATNKDGLFMLVVCYAAIPSLIKALSLTLIFRHSDFYLHSKTEA